MVMYTCSARHAAVNTGQVPVLTSLSPSPPKQWVPRLKQHSVYPWSNPSLSQQTPSSTSVPVVALAQFLCPTNLRVHQ